MKNLYVMSAVCVLCACQAATAKAEGFALTQWSARGMALAGGMVGRADDPSALAYNAAGITRLSGTRVMGGLAVVDPDGVIDLNKVDGTQESIGSGLHSVAAPHAYISRQINDRYWFGLGMFSRFGLDNKFHDEWSGRYDLTDVKLQTYSIVPTLAVKASDALSFSAGVEIMYAGLTMGQQIPVLQHSGKKDDIKMTVDGSSLGVGAHFGVHLRLSDKLSLGLAYKTPVALNISGSADFSRSDGNQLADQGQVPHAIDTGTHSKLRLPDSFSMGLAYRPLDNLSLEVGGVYTRWSAYDSLDIVLDTDFRSISKKKWRNGWNINASVEYEPMDWLALRAGVWYETPVVNEANADFMVLSHGRTGVSLGTGLQWENWRVDVGYARIWMRSLDYSRSSGHSFLPSSAVGDVVDGRSRDLSSNIYSASVSYSF